MCRCVCAVSYTQLDVYKIQDIYRMNNIPLNKFKIQNEMKIIYDIAIKNGYNPKIIDNLINKMN